MISKLPEKVFKLCLRKCGLYYVNIKVWQNDTTRYTLNNMTNITIAEKDLKNT